MSFEPHSENFSVTIRDENFPRSEVVELLLKLSSANLTVRNLIAERVRTEFDQRLIDRQGKAVSPLIGANPKEAALNGDHHSGKINPERQVEVALKAFETNGFILLIDDRQVETLEEKVEIHADTVVTFLKLTPLVGG